MSNILELLESKKISSDSELESATIDFLRFPLAIAVVFIHSFGTRELNLDCIHTSPLSPEAVYEYLRIFFSGITPLFAVPTFFMFSGFLFFYKLKEWNRYVYFSKLKKRFRTLFVPYLLWLFLFLAYRLAGVLSHGNPLSSLWEYIVDNGGIHMFWDSIVWGVSSNWLGMNVPLTAPCLVALWFVRDLLVTVLFTPVIYYLVKKYRIRAVILLGVLYLSNIFIPIPGFSATSFFWFSLGAYFSIHNMNMVESIRMIRVPSYVIAIVTLIPLVWYKATKGGGITTNILTSVIYYIYIMAAVFSVVGIASTLLKKHVVGINKNLSKTTFFIFVSHAFIIGPVKNAMSKINPDNNYLLESISYLISPFITVVICIAIFSFLNKYMGTVLSILVGSRK